MGDSANSSLIKAGGVTMLTIGDVKLKAENLDINVRSEPIGFLEDITKWTVPAGNPGDTFTMTQYMSTGSFGTNVRWYYELTCN